VSGDTPHGEAPYGEAPQVPPSGAGPGDAGAPRPTSVSPEHPTCDYCGSTDLIWIQCKLMCRHCHQMNLSCSDL
jgi:hypothetical protein